MSSFAKKIVVITGGANGIGAACMDTFYELGATVISLDLKVQENRNRDRKCYMKCDVGNADEIQTAVETIIKRYDQIDCLINNAGWHPEPAGIAETTIANFDDVIRINLRSVFAMSKLCLPAMKITGGTIVNIASMVAITGQDLAASYCAAKAGILGLTKAMAIEMAKYYIRVNTVCPSNVETNAMTNWLNGFPDAAGKRQMIAGKQITGRMITAQEIANIVAYLASPLSSAIIGQNIEADGGSTLNF